jgi:hypothetical protein
VAYYSFKNSRFFHGAKIMFFPPNSNARNWFFRSLLLFICYHPFIAAESQTSVDFEQFTDAPSVFTGITPPVTVAKATFSGGQVLNAATFLPANPSTVYGTAHFCSGCLPVITIDFSEPVSNVNLLLLNGLTTTQTYTIEDDKGGSKQVTLQPNFESGAETITLPSTGITQVTITGGSGQWDFLIDNIKYGPAEEFKISFSAFIPHDNVPGPPFDTCRTASPYSLRRDLYYRGDNRSFSAAAPNYRVREKVTVIPDSVVGEAVDANGLKKNSIERLIGQTRSYAEDAILNNNMIDVGDDDGVPDDCILFHQAATALITDGNGMEVTVERINEHKVTIHLTGGPGNPLNTAAKLGANLDWDYTITIDTSADKPNWTLKGAHDGFPAYEIYINDQEIYTYSPGTPPFTFSNTIKLSGPLDVPVNKQGDLP